MPVIYTGSVLKQIFFFPCYSFSDSTISPYLFNYRLRQCCQIIVSVITIFIISVCIGLLFILKLCMHIFNGFFYSSAETILLYTGLRDKTCPNFCKDQSVLSWITTLGDWDQINKALIQLEGFCDQFAWCTALETMLFYHLDCSDKSIIMFSAVETAQSLAICGKSFLWQAHSKSFYPQLTMIDSEQNVMNNQILCFLLLKLNRFNPLNLTKFQIRQNREGGAFLVFSFAWFFYIFHNCGLKKGGFFLI